MMSGIGKDLNGDSQMTADDQFGLLIYSIPAVNIGWQFGADQHITAHDADGCPVLDMNNDRMVGIVEKFYKIASSPDTFKDVYSSTTYAESTYRSILESGRSFFTWLDIGSMHSFLRQISFDFGILPMPKYDEAQEGYYTVSSFPYTLYGIPVDAKDPSMSAAILECLASESYRTVSPSLFEVALKVKYASDNDASEMYDIIRGSNVFDIGRIFNDSVGGKTCSMFRSCLMDNKDAWISTYEKNVKAMTMQFNKVVEKLISEE